MKVTTEAVTIIGYGPWDEDNAKYGEWVRLKAPTDEDTRRYSLAKDINGDRPAVGEVVIVTLHSRMKATAYNDAQGKAQSGSKEALKAVGFSPAKLAA